MADSITVVQGLLERIKSGDEEARNQLFAHSQDRLLWLTRVMLRDYSRVHRWEETCDVLQNALCRLNRALSVVVPATPADYYRLAAEEIRRELIDLARHYFGPEGMGSNQVSDSQRSDSLPPAHDPAEDTHDPAKLAQWTEFHQAVETLSAEEREVFNLRFYEGLSTAEIAALLDMTDRNVRYRYTRAADKLRDFNPEA